MKTVDSKAASEGMVTPPSAHADCTNTMSVMIEVEDGQHHLDDNTVGG